MALQIMATQAQNSTDWAVVASTVLSTLAGLQVGGNGEAWMESREPSPSVMSIVEHALGEWGCGHSAGYDSCIGGQSVRWDEATTTAYSRDPRRWNGSWQGFWRGRNGNMSRDNEWRRPRAVTPGRSTDAKHQIMVPLEICLDHPWIGRMPT